MKIYITYCSDKKDNTLKDSGIEVTPDVLYVSKSRIKPFMETCKRRGVNWAIFSDLYGIWFSDEKHPWYEKPPGDVTECEFKELLENFDTRLEPFEEIVFYRPNPFRFHSLYKRLLDETKLKERIRIIPSIHEIE